jgi:AmiR/NasT family two-component response regulator
MGRRDPRESSTFDAASARTHRASVLEEAAVDVDIVMAEGDGEATPRERALTMLVAQLQHALSTRETIGLAMGIIIARTGRDRDHAFRLLMEQSQHENRKLRDVAADIVSRAERQRGAGVG